MRDTICKCIYRHLIDEPVTWTSIITDFLMSSTIAIIGLVTNFRFRKKLQQERKATPPGRKGNVIEPIMRWYLIFAMIFWPYELLYLWINAHEIMPSSWFENCWLMNTMMHPIRIGRTIIAYNSFFVALIRYLYIVHFKRAQQWDFRKTGTIFQVASILVPLSMEIARILTEIDVPGLKTTERFQKCVVQNEGLNTTYFPIQFPQPATVEFTLRFLPRSMISIVYYTNIVITLTIGSNLVETFFYYKIFDSIKR